ncbi:MAG: Rrf2 family transcriptional regulator, partial [Bryobacteraceae bacterium]|nr:Rrf2 family transcriptional regulator [Bryobacteraceae bacterium]
TSEQVAKMLGTNPVVVRRTMAGLRKAGFVRSENGHGGGWTISCDLKKVTLLDIHRAVGGPRIFAIGNESDKPKCAVERVVNAALTDALSRAEALLVKKLKTTALADLLQDFDALCRAEGWSKEGPPTGSRKRPKKPL